MAIDYQLVTLTFLSNKKVMNKTAKNTPKNGREDENAIQFHMAQKNTENLYLQRISLFPL